MAGTKQVAPSRQPLATPGAATALPAPAAAGPHTDTGAAPALPTKGTAEASLKTGLALWACQGLPRCRQERLKAKIQLGSETLVLHGSHPLKCPAAALENCCSKVYFQHRNKQCEA